MSGDHREFSFQVSLICLSRNVNLFAYGIYNISIYNACIDFPVWLRDLCKMSHANVYPNRLLNANKINCLRVDSFQDLQNLNLLSLYDNKLQTIAKGTFSSLRAIQTLWVILRNICHTINHFDCSIMANHVYFLIFLLYLYV